MAINSTRISVTTTAITLLPSATFKLTGDLQDPLPVIIRNEDTTNPVVIGGPGVTATTGMTLAAGQSLPMAIYGNDFPSAIVAVTTVTVSVLVGRQ